MITFIPQKHSNIQFVVVKNIQKYEIIPDYKFDYLMKQFDTYFDYYYIFLVSLKFLFDKRR